MSEVRTGLTADEIANCVDSMPLPVDVPEWAKRGQPGSGKIWLRQLSAEDWVDIQNRNSEGKVARNGMYLICAISLCDEDGVPLYPLPSMEEPEAREARIQELIAIFRKKNFLVLDRLQKLALKHNGVGVVDDGERKNDSGGAVTADSPSA